MQKIIFILAISLTALLSLDTAKATGITEDGEHRFVMLGEVNGAYGSVIYVKNINKHKDQWRLERLGREKLLFTTTCDKYLFDGGASKCKFNFSNGVELEDTIKLMK